MIPEISNRKSSAQILVSPSPRSIGRAAPKLLVSCSWYLHPRDQSEEKRSFCGVFIPEINRKSSAHASGISIPRSIGREAKLLGYPFPEINNRKKGTAFGLQ
jgi:hypothetical protein